MGRGKSENNFTFQCFEANIVGSARLQRWLFSLNISMTWYVIIYKGIEKRDEYDATDQQMRTNRW